MKDKGFTLIELLAVIIILGILMLIAIPSVTNYINNSRKNSYVSTANEIIKGANNLVNNGELDLYDPNSTYYIPSSCINLESGGKSPYGGSINPAYVIVTYDSESYDYYWLSKDENGIGFNKPTRSDKLSADSIVTGIDDNTIKPIYGIDGKNTIIEFDESDCKSKKEAVPATNPVNGETGEYPIGIAADKVIEQGETIEVNDEERYVGDGPNNYVLFNDEKWRIISVFDGKLKIVKATPLPTKRVWHTPEDNDYQDINPIINYNDSKIHDYLNGDYYNSLTDSAKEMINENSSWDIGASSNAVDAASAYNYAHRVTTTAKVGLIANYDYLYASPSNCWTVLGRDYGTQGCSNWMYNALTSNGSAGSYMLNRSVGYVSATLVIHYFAHLAQSLDSVNFTNTGYVSPVVYLKPSVKITGGFGSEGSPFVLE